MTGSNRKTTKRLPIENWKINNNSMANIEFEAEKKIICRTKWNERQKHDRKNACLCVSVHGIHGTKSGNTLHTVIKSKKYYIKL